MYSSASTLGVTCPQNTWITALFLPSSAFSKGKPTYRETRGWCSELGSPFLPLTLSAYSLCNVWTDSARVERRAYLLDPLQSQQKACDFYFIKGALIFWKVRSSAVINVEPLKNIEQGTNTFGFRILTNVCWVSAQYKVLQLTLWRRQRWIRAVPGLWRAHSLSVKTDTNIHDSNPNPDWDECYQRKIHNVLWSLGEGEPYLECGGCLEMKEEFLLREETCRNVSNLEGLPWGMGVGTRGPLGSQSLVQERLRSVVISSYTQINGAKWEIVPKGALTC